MGAPTRRALAALVTIAAAVAVLGWASAPAGALSRTSTDPATAPASVDVTAVRYSDGERSTVTRVTVRRLPRAGTVRVRIAPASGGAGYLATVARTRAGTMTTALSRGGAPVTCPLGVTWSRLRNRVDVTVPQSCLDFGRFVSRHRFQAVVAGAAGSDRAPARVVGRGDSPGCVTPVEIGSLRVGQAVDAVHLRFDTAGSYAGTEDGAVVRSYAGCGDGNEYLVRYVAGRVAGWSVLGAPPVA